MLFSVDGEKVLVNPVFFFVLSSDSENLNLYFLLLEMIEACQLSLLILHNSLFFFMDRKDISS